MSSALESWKDQYADDLVIIADALEELSGGSLAWNEATEKKWMSANAWVTKNMICGTSLEGAYVL